MKYIVSAFVVFLSPFMAYAVESPENFSQLVDKFLAIISVLVPLVFGLAFIRLTWGIIKAWILGGTDEKAIEDGKHQALIGVVVLAVMSGIWGILAILRASLL